MMDISRKTDEELENIIRMCENTHSGSSDFNKAKQELEIRRNRKLFEIQQNIFIAIQSISQKPFRAIFWGGTGAIIIGVIINIISAYLQKILIR
jgi:hypothetical protein